MNNATRDEIHAIARNAGWWGGDEFPTPEARVKTALMLVVTELAEAAEGVRKGLMDDHLPDHPMFDVELADAAIRLLDLAGALDVDVDDIVGEVSTTRRQIENNYNRNQLEQLFYISRCVTDGNLGLHGKILLSLAAIWVVSGLNDVPIITLIGRKSAYNKTRADHKPENRAKEHGKKY